MMAIGSTIVWSNVTSCTSILLSFIDVPTALVAFVSTAEDDMIEEVSFGRRNVGRYAMGTGKTVELKNNVYRIVV